MRVRNLLLLIIIMYLLLPQAVFAQPAGNVDEYEKGLVVNVTPLGDGQKSAGFITQVEVVQIKMLSGPQKGEIVESFHYLSKDSPFNIEVQPGDSIIVAVTRERGEETYHISDFERLNYTYWLLGLFALSLIIVGRWVGVRSLLVIVLSVFLVCTLFVPEALRNRLYLPFLAVVVSSFIGAVALFVIAGWNRKSLAAIIGTVGGLVVAGVFSYLSIKMLHLSGLVDEESLMLKLALHSSLDFKQLLFAGMLIGALGAIIDTTISIASAVYEIKCLQPGMDFWGLFRSGMNVGYDTMGMMSNTLILAYLGNRLPLLLLILAAQKDIVWSRILNFDMVVTEIASAITGGIGIIIAIPLTAGAAAFLLQKGRECAKMPFAKQQI